MSILVCAEFHAAITHVFQAPRLFRCVNKYNVLNKKNVNSEFVNAVSPFLFFTCHQATLMIHLSKILCPTDYSDTSDKAVRYAIEFARKVNAHVRFLHVQPPENIALKTAASYGLNLASQENEDVIPQNFAGVLMAEKKNGLCADIHILRGEASKVISDHAAAWGADLIIMGSHGRTGLMRLMVGSVAEAVFRSADVPVLLVKQSDSEKALNN